MSLKTLTRKPLVWLYTGGVAVLLVGAGLWCFKVNTDPELVFWRMIDQSLATKAVTVEATQDNAGATMHQTVQYSLGSTNLVHTLTTISQTGTEVRNEMIATPTVDYTRYLSINTDQKNASGKDLDFSKIVGVWAKSQEGGGQLFPQAVLGIALPLGGMTVPIGNLAPDVRADIVKQMRDDNAYKIDFQKVKKEKHGKRQVYVYDVSIEPVAYAGIIKQFSRDLGLHQLDELDPNTYRGQQAIKLQFVVDVRSQHLTKVTLPANGYSQSYVSYDVPVGIELPEKTVTTSELQKRLSEL